MSDKIIMKLNEGDKEKFKTSAKALGLTLSGFMKLSASEKSNKLMQELK